MSISTKALEELRGVMVKHGIVFIPGYDGEITIAESEYDPDGVVIEGHVDARKIDYHIIMRRQSGQR